VRAKSLGRVHQTAIQAMALEIYYRHLPIYDNIDRVINDDDFPL
jgi:hypothetical protein